MLTLKDQTEQGQGLVEYAMILVTIALVVMAVLALLGPIVGNMFSSVNTDLTAM